MNLPSGEAPPPGTARATYRIGAVARLTGISTHALRIWERRYGSFSSTRSPKGGRLYTEDDVARLTSIRRLLDRGHAVGAVATLEQSALEALLQAPAPLASSDAAAVARRALVDAVDVVDVELIGQRLGSLSAGWPATRWLTEVIGPALVDVGERWAAGEWCVAQEHAFSAALRTHLGDLWKQQTVHVRPHRRAVATTLSGERHELGALMATVVAAEAGWRVTYLGPDLPVDQVTQAARDTDSSVVLISMSTRAGRHQAELVRQLRSALPATSSLVAGGGGARHVNEVSGVITVVDLPQLADALRAITP